MLFTKCVCVIYDKTNTKLLGNWPGCCPQVMTGPYFSTSGYSIYCMHCYIHALHTPPGSLSPKFRSTLQAVQPRPGTITGDSGTRGKFSIQSETCKFCSVSPSTFLYIFGEMVQWSPHYAAHCSAIPPPRVMSAKKYGVRTRMLV